MISNDQLSILTSPLRAGNFLWAYVCNDRDDWETEKREHEKIFCMLGYWESVCQSRLEGSMCGTKTYRNRYESSEYNKQYVWRYESYIYK